MKKQTLRSWRSVAIVLAAILTMMGALTARAEETAGQLPAAALAAIKAKYSDCTITSVEMETERKIRFFEVEITLPGREIEMEITGAGAMIESEEDVKADTLSPALKAEVANLTDSGRSVVKIEKHEVFSVPCLGSCRQLAKPIVYYDLKTRDGNGIKQSILLEDDASKITKISKRGDDDGDDDDDDDDDD